MNDGPFRDFIDDDLGRVIDRGGGLYDVILERRIKKPIEKVWAALTIPERIADWFTEADLDLRVGGHYRLNFPQESYAIAGVIIACEPMRLLAHTWPDPEHPDSVVRYELEPDGKGCRLTLIQTNLTRKYVNAIAGWHTFLEALPGAAEGSRTAWRREREAEIGERYRHLLPA